MKTFRWMRLKDVKGNQIVTLFDMTDYQEKATLLAVGSVLPVGFEYRPFISYPERKTTEETMSFHDAKEAVEKKLFDDGVIAEGDTIEDDTEHG